MITQATIFSRLKNPISIFLLALTLEFGGFFLFQTFLPGGENASGLFGLSTTRMAILAAFLSLFLLSGFFCVRRVLFASTQTGIDGLVNGAVKKISLLLWVGLILIAAAIFYFTIPETIIRGPFKSLFIRIDPFVQFFVLIFMEFLGLLIVEKFFHSTRNEWNGFTNNLISNVFAPLLVFFFPFFYLFPRTIPINGEFYGVANDFLPTSYTYKVYLLDCFSKLHFPLWSPAESAGYPFFSNPFSQFFYPLNIPMTGLYIINNGYSILDNQRFAVLGIAIFALGFYFWLREFSLSNRAVLIVSLIIPVSYKLAELIRYPSGLHSIAWYPWILLALTRLVSARSIRQACGPMLLLIFAGICLVTGGYQYYLFYSVFLFIPYLILLCVPLLRKKFFLHSQPVRWMNFAAMVVAGLMLILIAGPYALRMANLLSLTSSRGGGNFSFSTSDGFNFIDTLGSLVYPPTAQAEGWYFFGFASVVLILVFLVSRRWFKGEAWASADGGKTWKFWFLDPWVSGALCLYFVLISYITYGEHSYLFIFLWKYFPFFSHLRFIGRLNVVLLPVIGLLLAISIDFFSQVLKNIRDAGENRRDLIRRWALITLLAFSIPAGIQFYLINFQSRDIYWTKYLHSFAGKEAPFVIMAICVLFLFTLTYVFNLKRQSRSVEVFWIAFSLVTLIDMWPMSAFMWWNGTQYMTEDQRKPVEIVERVFKESFEQRRDPTYNENAISLKSTYRVNYSDDWYFSNYRDFYLSHEFEPQARERLLGVTDGQRVFYTRSVSYNSITEFLKDADSTPFEYEILEFNGDRLRLMVNAPEDGYISYIDNWDPEWKVYVNGQETVLEKLFATFKTVHVQKGSTTIVFSYEPNIFGIDFQAFKKK